MGPEIPGIIFKPTAPKEPTDEGFHLRLEAGPTAPERTRKNTLPRILNWVACQAVRFDSTNKYIDLRSFPFWALSIEHARRDLLEMAKVEKQPYTHIYVLATLTEKQNKPARISKKLQCMNIKTGGKT